jgi:hypothetical protein
LSTFRPRQFAIARAARSPASPPKRKICGGKTAFNILRFPACTMGK